MKTGSCASGGISANNDGVTEKVILHLILRVCCSFLCKSFAINQARKWIVCCGLFWDGPMESATWSESSNIYDPSFAAESFAVSPTSTVANLIKKKTINKRLMSIESLRHRRAAKNPQIIRLQFPIFHSQTIAIVRPASSIQLQRSVCFCSNTAEKKAKVKFSSSYSTLRIGFLFAEVIWRFILWIYLTSFISRVIDSLTIRYCFSTYGLFNATLFARRYKLFGASLNAMHKVALLKISFL